MRKYITILVLSFFTISLHAQDTLYKTDGNRQVVNILEINQSQVKYKPYMKEDAPPYIILKTSISKIVDKNGNTTTFAGFISPVDSTHIISNPTQHNSSNGRNFISMNVADLFVGILTLNYEYTLESGKLSLKVPLSTGFYSLSGSNNQYNDSYYPGATIIGTGIGLNFYPRGQRPVSYFLGPALYYRLYNYSSYDPVTYIYKNEVGSLIGIFIQNGVLFHAGQKFNLSIDVGLGYLGISQTSNYYTNQYEGIRFRIGINVGLKF